MPNHCTNVVTMRNIGREETLYDKYGNFSFDALMPQPQSLNIIDGAITSHAMELVQGLYDIRMEHLSRSFDKIGGQCSVSNADLLKKHMPILYTKISNISKWNQYKDMTLDDVIADIITKGLTYMYNTLLYGYPTWYDWNIQNWGTKWPAYNTQIVNNDVVTFDTAWNIPYGILEALSAAYPYDLITDVWIEEGGTCGISEFHGGEMIGSREYLCDWSSVYDEENDQYRNRLFMRVTPMIEE